MINIDQIDAFAFSAPIVCALACMIMMLMDAVARRHNVQEKRLRLFLALTYLITSLGWLGMVFYSISPASLRPTILCSCSRSCSTR